MKRIITFIILVATLCPLHALNLDKITKTYVGVSVIEDYGLGFDVGLWADTTYFKEDFRCSINDKFYDVKSSSEIVYNAFVLGSDFEFSNNTRYLNVSLGFDFVSYIYDWIQLRCRAKVGYIPFVEEADCKANHLLLNHLDLDIYIYYDLITIYTRMDCRDYFNGNKIESFSFKNTLGIKAEKYFGKIGVYALYEYNNLKPGLCVIDKYNDDELVKNIFNIGVYFIF